MLLFDIYSFHSGYKLIQNICYFITCIYYFDYHRPDLFAPIKSNLHQIGAFFSQSSLFQRISQWKRFVLFDNAESKVCWKETGRLQSFVKDVRVGGCCLCVYVVAKEDNKTCSAFQSRCWESVTTCCSTRLSLRLVFIWKQLWQWKCMSCPFLAATALVAFLH